MSTTTEPRGGTPRRVLEDSRCTERTPAAGGAERTYDDAWVDSLDEATIGLRVATGVTREWDEPGMIRICWAATG